MCTTCITILLHFKNNQIYTLTYKFPFVCNDCLISSSGILLGSYLPQHVLLYLLFYAVSIGITSQYPKSPTPHFSLAREISTFRLDVGDVNHILMAQYLPAPDGGHLYFVFKSHKNCSALMVKIPVSCKADNITKTTLHFTAKCFCACLVTMGTR